MGMVLPWILKCFFFFLRAKIKCERHRMSLLWDNKSCHVHAWRHLSFQSWTALQCCQASSAPGTERCLFLFWWEVPGSFREHTWFAPNSTPSAPPAELSPLTLVPCVVYSGSDLLLPSGSPGWLAIKKKKKKEKRREKEKKGNYNFPLSLPYNFGNSKDSHGVTLKELLQETSPIYLFSEKTPGFFSGTGFAATKAQNVWKGIEMQRSRLVVQ